MRWQRPPTGAGAKFVDLSFFDPYFKRARVLYADPGHARIRPAAGTGERLLAIGEHHCARVSLSGLVAPHLMDDLDPELVGRDMLPRLREGGKVLNDRTTNWTIGPCPTADWAEMVYPDLEGRGRARATVGGDRPRLPARRGRSGRRVAGAAGRADDGGPRSSTSWQLDTPAVRGPGDRSDGRPAAEQPLAVRRGSRPSTGSTHAPNLPTEEVFTTPDPERDRGDRSTATKPLFSAPW